MFSHLETLLLSYIHTLPLEIFIFIASFIEEVIAPIPSPPIMMLAGSFAAVQGYLLPGFFMLVVVGALGKTVGAVIVYFVADKAEDVVIGKFGNFFGVTRDDVEGLGKKLGAGPRDYLILTFLRALPIMPSSVVSVGSGLLKVKFRLYLISTFIGTILRDGIYLYVGYVGADILKSFIDRSTRIESYIQIAIVAGALLFMAYLIIRQRKNKETKGY